MSLARHRGESLADIVSRLSPSEDRVDLGDGEARSREEVVEAVTRGVDRALEDCTEAGGGYPSLREDSVLIIDGKVSTI